MHRGTKQALLFLFGVSFTCIYCEFLIYYIVVAQCSWPVLMSSQGTQVLKALIIADTHLLGPRKGHWLDKWRREWQMHQAFQAIVRLHEPDAVFVLGDLFDEGEWSSDNQFRAYVERFHELFPISDGTDMFVVAGNHDIGFHNYIRRGYAQRFTKLFNASVTQFLTIKESHFVLLNSMAMEGDSCQLCTRARNDINKISGVLKCSQNEAFCYEGIKKINYSRPILMQHFPLYRLSDAVCNEEDAPPLPLRNKPFRLKIDALSKEATEYLVSKLKPRAVFGGHTHHGCLLHHSQETPEAIEFYEYSVPSFSWRNRPDPKYMLVTITSDDYATNKCGLPKETTIAITAVLLLCITIWYTGRRRQAALRKNWFSKLIS